MFISNKKCSFLGRKVSRLVVSLRPRKILLTVFMALAVVCWGMVLASQATVGDESMDALFGMRLDELVELKVTIATGHPSPSGRPMLLLPTIRPWRVVASGPSCVVSFNWF